MVNYFSTSQAVTYAVKVSKKFSKNIIIVSKLTATVTDTKKMRLWTSVTGKTIIM